MPGEDKAPLLVHCGSLMTSGTPRINVCSAQSWVLATCQRSKPGRFVSGKMRVVHSSLERSSATAWNSKLTLAHWRSNSSGVCMAVVSLWQYCAYLSEAEGLRSVNQGLDGGSRADDLCPFYQVFLRNL